MIVKIVAVLERTSFGVFQMYSILSSDDKLVDYLQGLLA